MWGNDDEVRDLVMGWDGMGTMGGSCVLFVIAVGAANGFGGLFGILPMDEFFNVHTLILRSLLVYHCNILAVYM